MPRLANEPTSRRWCFTLNNYTGVEEEQLQAFDCRYMVYGREIAPTTGTPHLQGYLEITNAKSMRSLKVALGIIRISLRIANGDALSNKLYCTKDGDSWTKGEPGRQGERSDIAEFLDLAKRGIPVTDAADEFPREFVKYHQAYDKLKHASEPVRTWPMDVTWCYGPTGTGKSHWAHEQGTLLAYRKQPGKWWDGYDGHECVIFDEFRGDWFPFYQLLCIMDRYPLSVEIKGGHRQFRAKRIIVTCPVRWDELFRGQTQEKLDQLERRITLTKFFPNRYVPRQMNVIVEAGHPEAEEEDVFHEAEVMDNFVGHFLRPIGDRELDEIASMFDDETP